MAEVTGNFGQEDILLNNAATETSLRELINVTKAMAQKGGLSPQQLNKELTNLAKNTKDAAKAGKSFEQGNLRSYAAMKQNAKAVEDHSDALKDSIARINSFRNILGKVANAGLQTIKVLSGAANSIQGMDGSLSNMTSSLTSAAKAIPGLGMAAEAIEATYAPTVAALDKTRTAFQEAAQAGANFGGNMNGVVRSAAEMGVSLQDFSGLVKNNAESLMFLGGSTDEGAKRFAKFGKEMRKSELFNDLTRLGYGTTAINQGFADYTKMLAKGGKLQGRTDEQLRQGTADYLKNLDAVSKLTGKTKEALQAEQDARMADAQYRTMLRSLDADGQNQLKLLMDTIPKQHQQGLKEILATGTATSEEGMKAMAFLQKSGMSAQALHQQMQSSGTLTADAVKDFNNVYQAEAKAIADSPVIKTLGKFLPEYNEMVTGIYDVAERQKNIGTVIDETETTLKTIKDNIKKGVTDTELVDPATIENFRNKINEAANTMTANLNKVDITPLQNMFDKVIVDLNATENLPKALAAASNNINSIVGAAVAAELALMALAAAASMAAFGMGKGALGGKGKGKVPKVGGTGGAKPGGGGGGMLKNAGKGLLRGARFLPGIGAVVMAGSAVAGGISAGMNAEEVLGLDEGEAATAGETVAASVGGIVDGLTFGLVEAESVAKGLSGMFGLGANTIKEFEAKIAEEEARIKRSESGENEYFGRESKGIEGSKDKIAEYKAEIERLKKEAEEKKPQMSGGTLGAFGQLFGNFGSGMDATLHGMEAVVTPDQMAEVVSNSLKGTLGGVMSSAGSMLEPEKIAEAANKAVEQVGQMATPTSAGSAPTNPITELNNNMLQLIALTKESNNIAKRHVGVTTGLTNDAFSV